jgi:hypothetical protein
VYEDPTKLYNKAVCTAITSEEANDLSNHPEPDRGAHEPNANVIDDGSVSIISRLTAAWITRTITKTANVEQCDVQDLPIIRAEIRTQNLIREVGGQGLRKSRWGPTVALLWTVWRPRCTTSYKVSLTRVHGSATSPHQHETTKSFPHSASHHSSQRPTDRGTQRRRNVKIQRTMLNFSVPVSIVGSH